MERRRVLRALAAATATIAAAGALPGCQQPADDAKKGDGDKGGKGTGTGELRLFNSSFSLQLAPGNIRADKSLGGGGPLYDLGVYCINAARYFFREEPEEVFAFSSRGHDRRFAEVDEMTSAMLRFPGGRLAQFACSFGAYPSPGSRSSARKARSA